MYLKELATLLLTSAIEGNEHVQITGIQTDSRLVKQGDLFICLPGHTVDGHNFAVDAIKRGAVALVVEHAVDIAIPLIHVKDSRHAMAVFACHFYNYPSNGLKLIGITGTNGKTTTTYLLEKILTDQGHRVGLMGTIAMKIGGEVTTSKGTTQEALDLQRNLKAMLDVQTNYGVMEVSSHALEQGRVKGCRFRTAIFTNLTQDHLDYHKTMDNYKAAKGLLFSRMGNTFHPDQSFQQYAVLNADDPAQAYFSSITTVEVLTYGINNEADIKASDLLLTARGTEFIVTSFAGTMKFQLQMVGKFNVYNALGAIAATLAEGIPLEQIRISLEGVSGVEGRVEVVNEGQDFLVVVDYAHTPDGLENVLSSLQEFSQGKIICVFGCGGDRDRTKRPLMGKIAAQYSDYVYVTSDNPRSEESEAILQDIVPGIIEQGLEEQFYELNPDRRIAIQKAIDRASSKDVVLIAGKGHETYQIIKGVEHFFDDRLEAREAIRRKLT